MSSFMQPEVWQSSYWSIETNHGTEIVPCDVCDMTEEHAAYEGDAYLLAVSVTFRDYLEGSTVYSAERCEGYLARLSAPGYMDQTDTTTHDTELEAWQYLADTYYDQPTDEMDEGDQQTLANIQEHILSLQGISTQDVTSFIDGYIECMFWAETTSVSSEMLTALGLIPDDYDLAREDYPLEDIASPDDLSPEALATIENDCRDFISANADDLDYAANDPHCGHPGQHDERRPYDHLGHDFYLTRNGHGAGYWDRGNDPVWRRLTSASKLYGEQSAIVGDDGQIHVS